MARDTRFIAGTLLAYSAHSAWSLQGVLKIEKSQKVPTIPVSAKISWCINLDTRLLEHLTLQ
jgi:hypothetical protein